MTKKKENSGANSGAVTKVPQPHGGARRRRGSQATQAVKDFVNHRHHPVGVGISASLVVTGREWAEKQRQRIASGAALMLPKTPPTRVPPRHAGEASLPT